MIAPLRLKVFAYNRIPAGRDIRFRRSLRFLIAKGYVQTRFPPLGNYRSRISLDDLIWSAERVEPQFYRLLPALVLKFSGQIKGCENMPADLAAAVLVFENKSAVSERTNIYMDNELRDVRRWVEFIPNDKRIKGFKSKRRTFRIGVTELKKLERIAELNKVSLTEALHEVIKAVPEKT